ncbi:MAG: HD domain-containing protein [Terracidiphilus sp.]
MSRPLCGGLPVSLALLSGELQKAFSADLDSYAGSLRGREKPRGFKVINDPIWFTIRVESWELVILDSPVVQRLRGIHQLGLAGLVYPAAGYSRFEHTLGTLYQAQRVIESVNRNARPHSAQLHQTLDQPVSRMDEVALRLAALLHDVGHCFLSHVSERALDRLTLSDGSSMKLARRDARDYFYAIKPPAVGEVLSSLVILLPEFIDVLKKAKIPFWEDNEEELASRIARLVVRGRFSDRPFMNEIISGALDADKLDYMSRDCYMAGLAMPIDTERLLEKLCVVNVPAPHLEEYMGAKDLPANQSIQVLAVQQGGAKVFEDFVLSRVLLYDKLYNHHKVRALEGAVVNALEILQEHHPLFRDLSTYVGISDAQFLEGRWPDPETPQPEVERAQKLVREVKRRNVVRAFAFGSYLIAGFDEQDEPTQSKLRRAWGRLADVTGRDVTSDSLALRSRIRAKAQEYLIALGQPTLAAELHDSSLIVDLPDVQGIASRTTFFVGDESSGVRNFNELFKVDKWAEAYENQKITGYVFCPPEFAAAVHLAARDLIREDFKLSFEPWSWNLTKVSVERLEQSALTLRERGTDTEPSPVPSWLQDRKLYLQSIQGKMIALEKYTYELDQLAERFVSYQSHTDEKITRHRMEDWLLQFAAEQIPFAVTVLQHVRYWDRASITDAFAHALVDWGEEIHSWQWVPLGGPTTSSNHLNYLWPDLKKQGLCPRNVLGDAERLQEGSAIVFYDDNVGSAGQSKTVLQQWLGMERDSWDVDEEHVQPLPKEKVQILKNSRIRFLFATGRRRGLENLITKAKQLFENHNIDGHIVIPQDVSCFQPASGVFGSRSLAQKAQEAFRAAGERALADKREAWGEEKMQSRLLGYGNSGGLNVFYYNVPTTTITALWKSSEIPGSSWMGLFPRRPRE